VPHAQWAQSELSAGEKEKKMVEIKISKKPPSKCARLERRELVRDDGYTDLKPKLPRGLIG
jgi:hypothetical protein